jgi:hypothetical protein
MHQAAFHIQFNFGAGVAKEKGAHRDGRRKGARDTEETGRSGIAHLSAEQVPPANSGSEGEPGHGAAQMSLLSIGKEVSTQKQLVAHPGSSAVPRLLHLRDF